MVINQIRNELVALGKSWQAKQLDGTFTVSEFFDFSREAIQRAMTIVAPIKDGPTKKKMVLEWAGTLFDFFAPFIKSRFPWLAWFAWLFGEDLRDEYLALVSLWIEVVYRDEFKPA
jgi:hypothetical protein